MENINELMERHYGCVVITAEKWIRRDWTKAKWITILRPFVGVVFAMARLRFLPIRGSYLRLYSF